MYNEISRDPERIGSRCVYGFLYSAWFVPVQYPSGKNQWFVGKESVAGYFMVTILAGNSEHIALVIKTGF